MLLVSLLGQFTVQVDGRPVNLTSRPAQTLLAYLLLHPNVAHQRTQLAGLLWPDSVESTALKNLRNAVWQLRKALDERYISVQKDTIAFEPTAAHELDIALLGNDKAEQTLPTLIDAVSAYKGDLLPGFYEDWVQLARERLRGQFERRIQSLLDGLTAAERWVEVLSWAEHWIALGHVPEPAYRALMLAHAARGDLAGVAAVYQRCVQALRTELAVSPSAETHALFERLVKGDAAEPAPRSPAERYRRGRLLAVGGQGELYAGRDLATGKPVVIKRLLPSSMAGDTEAVARFAREADLLRQLNHPNIVEMLALIEQADERSLVMEYMPGGTLRDLLDQQPQLPLNRVLDIGLELADALARAHHLGIIHRDVKPENVLLAVDGTPRLTDFGLARLLRDDVRLTQVGTALGTPIYMSPEAVRGEALDARSDIWSMGIMLYEMLAGRCPFEGPQLPAVLAGVLYEPAPDIKKIRPDVPPALERLLGQMLIKDRAARMTSMRQVAAELEAVRAGHLAGEDGSPAEKPPSPLREPLGPARHPAEPVSTVQQQIRFCTTPDQVRLAYATLGAGPVLVKAGNPLTHLEHDLHSPVWRHWWQGLAQDHSLVRYDQRGTGLSDWRVSEHSLAAWVSDLETVVEQLGPEPFVLLGVSHGAPVAIAYAARHPERVSHLILYGGWTRGRHRRAQTPEQHDEAHTLVNLMRLGWGKDNPAFRQVFASLYMPEATVEQMRWYTDLARVTTSPDNAAAIEMAFYEIDVTDLASQVTTPTLVLHARGDAVCPFEEGRMMAALIPGSRFVPLDSNNHILLESEAAWARFLSEVRELVTVGQPAPAGAAKATPPAPVRATPPLTPARQEQQIRFCQAADGVSLAYATIGDGPALVKAANWLSHLEFDWISPIWRHWVLGLAETHSVIRYDERGCGLSDWDVKDISFEAWVQDLETVVDASGVDRFALLGISQGGPIAIAYALRHPERVSHLVLYGTYARGRLGRELTSEQVKEYQALVSLVRSGWGQENPAFRQVFTSYFIPGGTFEQFHWFNDLQRVSASPENAARMIEEFAKIDVRKLAPQIEIPTLVLHAVNDARIPFAEGRLVAALIPGARFVPLDSRNHILLESEPAWQRFLSEVRQFLEMPQA